jgi:hypothetical protein
MRLRSSDTIRITRITTPTKNHSLQRVNLYTSCYLTIWGHTNPQTRVQQFFYYKYIYIYMTQVYTCYRNTVFYFEVFLKYKNLMFVTLLMMARGAETCCEERE